MKGKANLCYVKFLYLSRSHQFWSRIKCSRQQSSNKRLQAVILILITFAIWVLFEWLDFGVVAVPGHRHVWLVPLGTPDERWPPPFVRDIYIDRRNWIILPTFHCLTSICSASRCARVSRGRRRWRRRRQTQLFDAWLYVYNGRAGGERGRKQRP